MNLIEKLEGMRKFAVEHYNPMAASGAITVIHELISWHNKQSHIQVVMQAEGSERPDYYSQFNLPKDVVHNLQRIALSDDEQAKEAGFVYRQIAQDILKAALVSGAAVGQRSVGTGVSDGHKHNFKYTESSVRFKCSCGKYEDEYLSEASAAARD